MIAVFKVPDLQNNVGSSLGFSKIASMKGGQHSTEVTFVPRTQPSRV